MTDREKLAEIVERAAHRCLPSNTERFHLNMFVRDLISNGVVVREKGEWMEMVDCVEDGYTGEYYEEIYYNCLNCDYATTENTPFCPNCGADMRGAVNDG